MSRGHVRQRHTDACPRAADGSWTPHRCPGGWEFRLELGRGPDGRRLRLEKGGFSTRREAVAALQDALEDARSGVRLHSRVTVASYLASWLEAKRSLRPSTVRVYRQHIDRYLNPALGHLELRALDPSHVDRLLDALGARGAAPGERPLSATTIRRVQATLRSALADARRARLIGSNPARHVSLPPLRRPTVTVWNLEELITFLDQVRSHRLHALFRLVAVTGLRRGEAVGLRWRDVDLDRATLRVVQQVVDVGGTLVFGPPKTRAGTRLLPLDPTTVTALRRHADTVAVERALWGDAWHDTGLVFGYEDGHPLRPEYLTRTFQRLAHDAGLPRIRFHDLRHTSASLALAAGIPLKVVSDRLGHSSLGIPPTSTPTS